MSDTAGSRRSSMRLADLMDSGMPQHSLFVANDDFGGVEIDKLFETVISVDDSAIEVVQIAGGEVAAFEQNERAKIRRNDRDDVHDHPLGLVFRAADGFDHLQT